MPGTFYFIINLFLYAGPHDYLNSWGYDLFGNLKNQTGFERFLGLTLNPLNVVIATPIAVPTGVNYYLISATLGQSYTAAPAVVYGLNSRRK